MKCLAKLMLGFFLMGTAAQTLYAGPWLRINEYRESEASDAQQRQQLELNEEAEISEQQRLFETEVYEMQREQERKKAHWTTRMHNQKPFNRVNSGHASAIHEWRGEP